MHTLYHVACDVHVSSILCFYNFADIYTELYHDNYLFQFPIKNWVLQRCSRTNLQKFVNDLMHAQYTTPFMAVHSLTGHKASKEMDSATRKDAMHPDEVKQLIGRISLFVMSICQKVTIKVFFFLHISDCSVSL